MNGEKVHRLLTTLVSSAEMFDLTRDNALEFLSSLVRGFEDRLIEPYRKSKAGLWVPERGYKTLRVIDSRIVKHHSIEIGLSCDEETGKTEDKRVYEIAFTRAPRFAFLKSKINDTGYEGLFYSQGSFADRYGDREQRVLLIR